MSVPTYEAVRTWLAIAAATRAERARALRTGAWQLRSDAWPDSYSHNALLLTTDPGPDAVVALAAEAAAGLAHQQVTAYCPLSPATLGSLRVAGFAVATEVLMGRSLEGAAAPWPAAVRRVDPGEDGLRRLHEHLTAEVWSSGAGPGVADQLMDVRLTGPQADSLRTLVADVDGTAAATIDVYLQGRWAELEGLATLPAARGRGLGEALMTAAVSLAADAGCGTAVLVADLDDWPRSWYARLGFHRLGPVYDATLV